ncbi:olefin beta-lactone synthetase OleC [soil metagenome]
MNAVTINVASHLAVLAATDPDRKAVIVPRGNSESSLTFGQLHEESDALANGLVAAGITAGSRIAVMVPPSLEFFTLTFALFKVAAVPVMIDPGMGLRNVGTCLAEAEPAAFIGIAKAHLARRIYGWAKGAITVNVGRSRFFCKHSTQSLRKPGPFTPPTVTADTTAAILFTSGSTGLAKGVVYTHGIFSAQVEMLKTMYSIQPGEIDLCTFPLFALFGPALGMTCVVPAMNPSRPATIDAARTIATIEKYKITNLFGSPAVIRRLGDYGNYHNTKLPTLKRAISAGAPASHDVIERFAKMLSPGVQLYTPYGATEALPVANIGSDELLATRKLTETGHGICIGRPVSGVTVHITTIRDDAVPVFDAVSCMKTGEIGEFVVRGPIVTQSYFRREAATALAKMTDPATGETLHRMGDVGYYDELGRLWFCGRKSQRVVTEQGTLFTDQVEPIFNVLANVHRTAVVGVKGMPVLCVELISASNQYDPDPSSEIPHVRVPIPAFVWRHVLPNLQHRSSLFDTTRLITTFLLHTEPFPVDPRHNSKINREKLAVWAAKQLREQKPV